MGGGFFSPQCAFCVKRCTPLKFVAYPHSLFSTQPQGGTELTNQMVFPHSSSLLAIEVVAHLSISSQPTRFGSTIHKGNGNGVVNRTAGGLPFSSLKIEFVGHTTFSSVEYT